MGAVQSVRNKSGFVSSVIEGMKPFFCAAPIRDSVLNPERKFAV